MNAKNILGKTLSAFVFRPTKSFLLDVNHKNNFIICALSFASNAGKAIGNLHDK